VIGIILGAILGGRIWNHIWPPREPEPKVITIIQPAKIVYRPGPSPAPIIIEKLVIHESSQGSAQVSFKQDIPFQDKTITAESFNVIYSGIYHVSMSGPDNLAAVSEEIVGNVKTSFTYLERPPPRNEAGPFYSTVTGSGVYYRRYFDEVKFGVTIRPWAEIRVGVSGSKNPDIIIGVPIQF
jgi:hypothetical protein